MKRLLATLAALAAITTIPACTDKTEAEIIKEPFGTDFSTILEDAGIELATDDYIVQCYPQAVNIFNADGKTSDSLESTFVSIESYNEYGESVQNGFGYVFKTTDDAAEYFEYVTNGIYEATLNNKHTVWFERESSDQYKQDIIEMLKDDLFESDITYISTPYLTKAQAQYSLPEHKADRCKG